MYSVYVLQSKLDKSYYIGSSKNRESRLWEHNYGRTGYTKKKRPWKIVYFEEYKSRNEGIKREKWLKRLKSKKYIQELISKGP